MIKAKPVFYYDGAYHLCQPEHATHVQLNMPGPLPKRTIPVCRWGSKREGTEFWSWNGDTEKPTLLPSIKTTWIYTHSGEDCAIDEADIAEGVCHTWVNDGMVRFLNDCTHELVGQTLPLLDVD